MPFDSPIRRGPWTAPRPSPSGGGGDHGGRSTLAWVGWTIVVLLILRFGIPLAARAAGLMRGLAALIGQAGRLGPVIAIVLVFLLLAVMRWALRSRRGS